MLGRLWVDHRWTCLVSLALLVIGVVVSPWVLLAAVVPVGWVLVRRNQANKHQKTNSEKSKFYLLFAEKIPTDEYINSSNSFYSEMDSSESIPWSCFGVYALDKTTEIPEKTLNSSYSDASDPNFPQDLDILIVDRNFMNLQEYDSTQNGLIIDCDLNSIESSSLFVYVVEVFHNERKVI